MRSVILSAGKSCFVSCPGCYNHFAPTLAETTDVIRFVSALRDCLGLEKVTVGGGDPLTRPDIVRLLSGLRELGLRIHLDTVGTAFLGEARIRFMGRGGVPHVPVSPVVEAVDLIGLPLDGSTDSVQRLFRRHSSVQDQQSILSLMDAADAKVCVNTVVHAGNARDLSAIADLIGCHPSVREWQLFQFMPIGPLGHRNRDRYLIDSEAFWSAAAAARVQVPRSVKVTAKSAVQRKHRYLLMDSAGVLWTPRQVGGEGWLTADENAQREVVGRIGDPDVFDRLGALAATGSGDWT